jgi:CheY-like chemotaxis protein
MSRILVIDDDPSIRLTVRRMLEDVGYEAIELPDGDAGSMIHVERTVSVRRSNENHG